MTPTKSYFLEFPISLMLGARFGRGAQSFCSAAKYNHLDLIGTNRFWSEISALVATIGGGTPPAKTLKSVVPCAHYSSTSAVHLLAGISTIILNQ